MNCVFAVDKSGFVWANVWFVISNIKPKNQNELNGGRPDDLFGRATPTEFNANQVKEL